MVMIMMMVWMMRRPLAVLKWPVAMVLNIWSMASSVGMVQLRVTKCLFSLWGMSFLPPPGWIMAAMYWMSVERKIFQMKT